MTLLEDLAGVSLLRGARGRLVCRKPHNGLTLTGANPHAPEQQTTTHAARVGVRCSVELAAILLASGRFRHEGVMISQQEHAHLGNQG